MECRSESIAKLAEALSKAQAVMQTARKDSENPYFKSNYADLSSVWDVARKPLTENGLSVAQLTDVTPDNGVIIETVLMHSSGEFITGKLRMPYAKADPQAVGSAITYGRRYALSAILGIVADEDDDGNTASGKTEGKKEEKKEDKKKDHQTSKGMSPEEMQTELWRMLLEICEGNAEKAGDELARITANPEKDYPGKRDPKALNTATNSRGASQTSVTFYNVRNIYEPWKKGQVNHANA